MLHECNNSSSDIHASDVQYQSKSFDTTHTHSHLSYMCCFGKTGRNNEIKLNTNQTSDMTAPTKHWQHTIQTLNIKKWQRKPTNYTIIIQHRTIIKWRFILLPTIYDDELSSISFCHTKRVANIVEQILGKLQLHWHAWYLKSNARYLAGSTFLQQGKSHTSHTKQRRCQCKTIIKPWQPGTYYLLSCHLHLSDSEGQHNINKLETCSFPGNHDLHTHEFVVPLFE